MSNEEFENYLALVSRLLRLNRSQREMIRNEMRDHLETRVEEMVDSGVDRKDAIRSALEEFGDAAGLANQFQLISNLNQKRWMMRFATFSIIGAFVAAVFMMSMWPGDARFGAPANSIAQQEDPFGNGGGADNNTNPFGNSGAQESDTKTNENKTKIKKRKRKTDWNKRIQTMLTSDWIVDYDETSFAEVMDELAEEFQINVLLDESASDDSLSPDTLVTLRLEGITVDKALRILLAPHNATFVVKDDVMRIISLDVANDPEYFRREIINCRSLLRLITVNEKYRVGTPISISPISEATGGGGEKGGGGFGGGNGRRGGGGVFNIITAQDEKELAEKTKATGDKVRAGQVATTPKSPIAGNYLVEYQTAEPILVDLIKSMIDPDGWDTSNGDGTAQIVGGCLVVSQTEEVIGDLRQLLRDLEQELSTRQ